MKKESSINRKYVRNSSWISNPWNCRSANHDDNSPIIHNYFIGFRVVNNYPFVKSYEKRIFY